MSFISNNIHVIVGTILALMIFGIVVNAIYHGYLVYTGVR